MIELVSYAYLYFLIFFINSLIIHSNPHIAFTLDFLYWNDRYSVAYKPNTLSCITFMFKK